MRNHLRSEFSKILELERERDRIKDIIEDLSNTTPADFDAHGLSGRHVNWNTSVGCATFTAVGGQGEVMNQLEGAIGKIERIVRGTPNKALMLSNIDLGTLKRTDRAIIDYVTKSGIDHVPDGKVMQYFACDIEGDQRGTGVCHVVEIPLACWDLSERKQTNRDLGGFGRGFGSWSFAEMLRGKGFATWGLENYVASLEGSIERVIDSITNSIGGGLARADLDPEGIQTWMSSVTDTDSSLGILVLLNNGKITLGKGESTQDKRNALKGMKWNSLASISEFGPMFCPECIKTILRAFQERGTIRLEFPPIPESVLELEVLCTENLHKEHVSSDLMSMHEVEVELNKLRAGFDAPEHRTIIIQIEDALALESYGLWRWMKI